MENNQENLFLNILQEKNNKLYKYILKTYNKYSKNGKTINWNYKKFKLYDNLLDTIDQKTSIRLNYLNNEIFRLEQKITYGTAIKDSTGWHISESGAEKTGNFKNMHDYEFREWDTWKIYRDELGFYVPINKNDYLCDESIKFLNEHIKEFEILHKLYKERSEIYNGNYSTKDKKNIKNDKLFIKLIIELLGLDKDYIINSERRNLNSLPKNEGYEENNTELNYASTLKLKKISVEYN